MESIRSKLDSLSLDPERTERPAQNYLQRSSQEYTKELLQKIVERIKKENNTKISTQDLLEAIEGNITSLFIEDPTFTKKEQEWLWAIHYCCNGGMLPPEEASVDIFLDMAAFFSCVERYTCLEKLFEMHNDLLKEEEHFAQLYDPLVFYAFYGHLEKVISLLRNKQSEEALGDALYAAVSNGYVSVVDQFFLKERTLTISNANKIDAFYVAIKNSDLEMVKGLVAHLKSMLSQTHKDEALFIAVQNKDPILVKFFLKTMGNEISVEKLKQAFNWVSVHKQYAILTLFLKYVWDKLDEEIENKELESPTAKMRFSAPGHCEIAALSPKTRKLIEQELALHRSTRKKYG